MFEFSNRFSVDYGLERLSANLILNVVKVKLNLKYCVRRDCKRFFIFFFLFFYSAESDQGNVFSTSSVNVYYNNIQILLLFATYSYTNHTHIFENAQIQNYKSENLNELRDKSKMRRE